MNIIIGIDGTVDYRSGSQSVGWDLLIPWDFSGSQNSLIPTGEVDSAEN